MPRLTTPFTARSTAAEVLAGVDLTGKRAVVTGGASGIGLETARALAGAGAEVTLAVRDLEAGRRAAAEIQGGTGRTDVRVGHLDLADPGSIDGFVQSWDGPLQMLVNNAGIMALPELGRTEKGHEQQFAINHLGHAALTLGLHDALAAAQGARIVAVASSAHQMSPVVFEDIDFTTRPYEAWSAYGQSKTATILFAVALAKRWAADGITANALHPGGIMTNLQRHLDEGQLAFVGALDEQGNRLEVPPGWKTPQQGAATSVLLAASPLVEGVTGRYFEDANESGVLAGPGGGLANGVAGYAIDADAADRLWDETIRRLQR